VANWLLATWMLWSAAETILQTVRDASWGLDSPEINVTVYRQPDRRQDDQTNDQKGESDVPALFARGVIRCDSGSVSIFVEHGEYVGLIGAGNRNILYLNTSGAHFIGGPSGFERTVPALKRVAALLPAFRTVRFAAVGFLLCPIVTGVKRVDGKLCLSIASLHGRALLRPNGEPVKIIVHKTIGKERLEVFLDFEPWPRFRPPLDLPPDMKAVKVDGTVFDRSLAAFIDLLVLNARPVKYERDQVRTEGSGRLVIEDGHRTMYLSGSPYEIGFQHGRLLASNIRRLVNRLVYGAGVYDSMARGEWFLDQARSLINRQRPFISPDYFEEMRGLSDGSGVPLELVQMANIFPEFFHCSGAALFGRATREGQLLHARVLDYMMETGLQDEAVVMAVEKQGAKRFVNVGYAGFIGSVSGMNESRIALGEMGGGGRGKWDGTPMSFLMREVLERCGTLEEALEYFRSSKRTCEYYYVVSDGNNRSAASLRATPEILEIIRAGEPCKKFPEAVPDASLISRGKRYRHLVQRVRDSYGNIDDRELISIIDRPVADNGNLHNVVFLPEELSLWVADAGRRIPACRRPYHFHTWNELFPGRGGNTAR